MQKVNYQLVLDNTINEIVKKNIKPTLLLHVCCAPCSSYVLEYLSAYFDITVFFFNPNISPESEYRYRIDELKRLLSEMPCAYKVKFIEGEYNTTDFYSIANGYENDDEGGERCFKCYRLRLKTTAELALKNNFDYFTTSLSISPYKNANKLNEIGAELEKKYGVKYLYSDFKKKNGYKRSIELSDEYGLYRQDYCGCIYSKIVSKKKKLKNSED